MEYQHIEELTIQELPKPSDNYIIKGETKQEKEKPEAEKGVKVFFCNVSINDLFGKESVLKYLLFS